MQSFDDMIQKFFENSDFPNPFDPEGFGRFLQEQIKNALPNDPNALNQTGVGKTDTNQAGFNQYPMSPHFDRSRLPNMGSNNIRGNRKGTTTGLNRAPIPQSAHPAQTNQAQPQQQPPPQQQQELNYQAFETHEELIIRVQIPEDPKLAPKNIKLASNQINFNNSERKEPLLKIQLPKAIDPDETKWGFRDGVLEVRLTKKPFEPAKEIDISSIFNSPNES